jgi:outer membrane protein OmpA-like peptidoglycan-associated protein
MSLKPSKTNSGRKPKFFFNNFFACPAAFDYGTHKEAVHQVILSTSFEWTAFMKYFWAHIILAIVGFGLPFATLAQPTKGELDLQASFGYTHLDDYGLANLGASYRWALQTSYRLSSNWALGVGYRQQSGLSILDDDAVVRTVELGPTYLFHPEKKHGAFAQATAGYQWIRLDQIENITGVSVGLGGGLRSQWSNLIATYVGVGFDHVWVGDPVDEGQSNFSGWVGFSLTLNPKQYEPRSKVRKASFETPAPKANRCQNMTEQQRATTPSCQADEDGDQVMDYMDLCPSTQAGAVDDYGCPRQHFARGIIDNISFEPGSARVTYKSLKTLKKISKALMQNKAPLLYTVEGHTDNLGDRKANQALSLARAKTVMNILTRHGLDRHRVDAIGYGEDYPIATNQTRAGREQNRRVEIKWLVAQ